MSDLSILVLQEHFVISSIFSSNIFLIWANCLYFWANLFWFRKRFPLLRWIPVTNLNTKLTQTLCQNYKCKIRPSSPLCVFVFQTRKKSSFSGDLQLSLGPRSRKLLLFFKKEHFLKYSMIIENQAYIGFLLITMKKLFLKKKITFYQKKRVILVSSLYLYIYLHLVNGDRSEFWFVLLLIVLDTSDPWDIYDFIVAGTPNWSW